MPRRLSLSASEQTSLFAMPESEEDLIRYYSFDESDLSLIRQRRGDANRLGFAVQLCLLRYPGYALSNDTILTEPVIEWIARSIRVEADTWANYGKRDETRREHFQELKAYLRLSLFGLSDFRFLVKSLTELATQTDKGLTLATYTLETLRQRQIILPPFAVIERVCAAAITRANRRIYRSLVMPLTKHHQQRLDNLLKVKPDTKITWLMWLRQSSLKPNSRYMLEHIERLKLFQALLLPEDLGKNIHQNRLLKMAREGRQMTPQDLSRLENDRRYATLVAVALERMATITDEIIDLHDRILIKIFRTAKNQHQQQFQNQGMEIKEKVQLYSKIGHALLSAKESGADPYAAIESVIPWEEFAQSILETDQLGQPKSFDHFYLVSEKFSMLRRYTPAFLDVLKLRNAPW